MQKMMYYHKTGGIKVCRTICIIQLGIWSGLHCYFVGIELMFILSLLYMYCLYYFINKLGPSIKCYLKKYNIKILPFLKFERIL